MATNVRRTGKRGEFDALWQVQLSLLLLACWSTFDDAGIGNGTTAGRLRTNASVSHKIAGTAYTKASTDDLWNLSAETNTTASQYRAYWLYLNSSGTASFDAGANAASAAAALAALDAPATDKSIIGVFVAGPSCDFDVAGGLAAQGTIYDQIPAGVPVGVPGLKYVAPAHYSLVGA